MALLRAHHLLLMRPRAAFSSRPPPLSSSPCRRALPTTAIASRLLCSHHASSPPEDASASASPSIVADLLDYLNESWTQFHATAEAKRQLLDAGFTLLSENDDWDLQPGGRYFFTRNMSCLIAFAVGEK
jgi:aspartyl aminopeptidase